MKFVPSKIPLDFSLSTLDDTSILLGTISKFTQKDFFNITNTWVKVLDGYIMKTKRFSDAYITLFKERAVTFAEYKMLFERIPSKEYKYHPAFEFFMLLDEIQTKQFIADKEATFESYYEVLLAEFSKGNLQGLHSKISAVPCAIHPKDLQTHAYITGRTGSGKSEFLKLLFTRIVEQTNDCLVLIDPHSDTAKQFAQIVQNQQPERLLYFDPFLFADEERYPVINPFFAKGKSEQEIDLLAKNLTAVFQELLPNELSKNMKAVLEPCISVLLHRENSSLVDLQRLVKGDKELLAEVKQYAKHHKLFFDNFNDSSYTQTKSAVFTKIQSLLNSRVFYNCVTGKNTIDLEKAIKDKKIIVCNLNKGLFGEEHAQAFGKLLIAQIKNFAFKQNENERQQIYLAVDECHNFISESMETILVEARKYKLSLILSNQMSKQLGSIEETTLSNVGAFFVGNSNSKETLQKISGVTDISFQGLKNIPKYHFWYHSDGVSFQFKASGELLGDVRDFEKVKENSFLYYEKYKQEAVFVVNFNKPKFGL